MRHTILQYDERNTMIIEKGSPLMPLVIHSQMRVATTRTANYRTACSLLGIRQIDRKLSFVLSVATGILGSIGP